jgi:hypothetical protein
MLSGIQRSAEFTGNGAYRSVLRRWWDDRPRLLVVMFNPSDANAAVDDPTASLVTHIAAHHGYGGFSVVNGIPLVSSDPAAAAHMVNTWDSRQAWEERDALQLNLGTVRAEVRSHRDILLAWGALASRCPGWFDHVLEQVREEVTPGQRLLCLGITAAGYPKHPMARGKHKVPRNAPLLSWPSKPD